MLSMTGWRVPSIIGGVAGFLACTMSITCRLGGLYCEYSLVSPDFAQIQRKDRALLDERLAKPSGIDEFKYLSAEPVGGWFWQDRLGIYANFADDNRLLVDTIPIENDDYRILYAQDKQIAAVAVPSEVTWSPEANLYAYFPAISFLQRQYSLNCRSDYDTTIAIRNLSYEVEKREFLFDFIAGCAPVLLNSQYTLATAPGVRGARAGATAKLVLTDTFHIASAKTSWSEEEEDKLRNEYDQSQRAFSDCRDRILKRPQKREGQLFSCWQKLAEPDNRVPEAVVFQWRDGSSQQVASLKGSGEAIEDPDNNAVFLGVSSKSSGVLWQSDTQMAQLKVVTGGRPQGATYEFKGYCREMSLRPQHLADAGGSFQLEIETDCTEIAIDGVSFSTQFKPTETQDRTKALYVLVVDENRFAKELRLVTTGSVKR